MSLIQFSQAHLLVHLLVYPTIGMGLEDAVLKDLPALLSSFTLQSSLPQDPTYQLPEEGEDQSVCITTHLFYSLQDLVDNYWCC